MPRNVYTEKGVRFKPSKYKKTRQQSKVSVAARKCGIMKGISKSDLMVAMKCCIPRQFGKTVPKNCVANARKAARAKPTKRKRKRKR